MTNVNNETTILYDNNVKDILGYMNLNTSGDDFGGIHAEYVSGTTYHLTGTIRNSDFMTLYANLERLPTYLKKDQTYYMVVEGSSSDCRIYFEFLGFRADESYTQVSFSGMRYNTGTYEFIIPNDFEGGLYVRIGCLSGDAGTVVDETITYHVYDQKLTGVDTSIVAQTSLHYEPASQYSSCDDIPTNTVTFVGSKQGIKDITDSPVVGTIWSMGIDNRPVQYAVDFDNPNNIYTRLKNGSWTIWNRITDYNNSTISKFLLNNYSVSSYSSCDEVTSSGVAFVSSINSVRYPPDFPLNGPGWLLVFDTGSSSNVFQMALPWMEDQHIKYRMRNGGDWKDWREIRSDSDNTTTIIQEVSRDTYNNTYNITTQPQITVDTNGWLRPVDIESEGESNKTDMTGPIMSMLNSTGYCHLAPGIYYVSGNIDMPSDSMIEGCGKQTIIRLLQSTTSGYIVRMHTRSTLKNLCLSGSYSPGSIANDNLGGRRGVNYIGNRDGKDSTVTPRTCTCCMIEGCFFENLDSGFYGYNAGGGLQEGVEMVNCYFTRCKSGINLDYWTEYCKFTNCITFQCYYGCINNGGNNVFTACTFHGVVGFLIDNSSGTKSNSAHGSVIGCTFNHIDNMNNPSELGKGYAIKVLSTTAGFLFSNCQIWYGRILVENSSGIQISGCEIGGIGGSEYPLFEFYGNHTVFVDNCLFQEVPINIINSPAKFTNCWSYNGNIISA